MLDWLFDHTPFVVRSACGPGWAEDPWLADVHVWADAATFAAYVGIPVALLVLVLNRGKHIPRSFLLVLFGIFILACGVGHLVDVYAFSRPAYRLAALVKVVTAAASVGTLVALVPAARTLLSWPTPEDFRAALARERAAHAATDAALARESAARAEAEGQRQAKHDAANALQVLYNRLEAETERLRQERLSPSSATDVFHADLVRRLENIRRPAGDLR